MNRTNNDRRAHICKFYYCPYNECTITDIPGNKNIQVLASWINLPMQTAELKENELLAGEMIEQELSVVLKGKNTEMDNEITRLVGKQLIIRLDYSNDESRIMGTRDNPVILSEESAGVIASLTLVSKHLSAEKTKKLTSF